MRTPAQVTGQYDFVTDVPIQGPTDEGIRAADCWWTQNVLPVKSPSCVDCVGPVPQWARNPAAWSGGPAEYGGRGCGSVPPTWYGDRRTRGWGGETVRYGLGTMNDPAATLTSDQQAWVVATLLNLNTQIGQATGTNCMSWQDPGQGDLTGAVRCFQFWYNASTPGGSLRTDGVLDQDTLYGLISTALSHPQDFPTQFPVDQAAVPPPAPVTPPAAPAAPLAPPPVKEEERGLSTGAKIGIGVASLAAVGGVVYAATRKKKA